MMWADLLIACGTPGYNHVDNEPGFVATAMKELDQRVGAKTAHIEPSSSWENGYVRTLHQAIGCPCLRSSCLAAHQGKQIVLRLDEMARLSRSPILQDWRIMD